ncbi:MAG TPA: DUF5996 family protein [Vicinamibacterales bacterium]
MRHINATADDEWPALPYQEWKDTYHTLHMWSQVVGKVALARSPHVNHSWGVALHVTGRGLQTHALPHEPYAFTMELDFVDHQLVIDRADGHRRTLPFVSRSVADFYRDVMATLAEMSLPVTIWSIPVEIPSPIPFEQDTIHHTYDPASVTRLWRILVQVERVFTGARSRFIGKCSPVHFFWGSFDMAVSRFSGRPAPPRDGPAFMRESYSHEVISHGFWPGSAPVLEPAFYAYAVPEPEGFESAPGLPDGAYYHPDLREYILPYDVVRAAASPDAAIATFIDGTYSHGATLAGWDRAALERPGPEVRG